MNSSIHIFLQINTDKLLLLGQGNPTNSQVRECTIISNQGSMSIGSPIKNFEIEVEANRNVHFSILPLNMMSFHKLYFTEFKVISESRNGIHIPNVHLEERQLSFCVNIGEAEKNKKADFNLNAVLEYEDEGGLKFIPICIDPKIRVTQSGDHP